MTIQASTPRLTWSGDGVSTVFPVNIQGYLASDFLVEELIVATGALTQLTLNSNYTMAQSGSLSPTYWTLTLPAALPIGTNLSVVINPAAVQQSQYVPGQSFPSAAVQTNLDRLTQMVIRLQDMNTRMLQFPDIDTANGQLPPAAQRAGLGMSFDSNGNIGVLALPATALTQATFNTFLSASTPYARSAAEISAGVTPTNPAVPYGQDWAYVSRYGGNITQALAVAAAVGTPFVLFIDTAVPVGSNLTVPSLVTLFGLGGVITIASTFTLTVQGPVFAPMTQGALFAGAGSANVTAGSANWFFNGNPNVNGNLVVGGNHSVTGNTALTGALEVGSPTGGMPAAGSINVAGQVLINNVPTAAAALTVASSPITLTTTSLVVTFSTLTLVAAGVYLIEFLLNLYATAAGSGYKINMQFTGAAPTSWTPLAGFQTVALGSPAVVIANPGGTNIVAASVATPLAAPDIVNVKTLLKISGTAGTLQLLTAQNTATGTLSIGTGSTMAVTRLA